MTTKKERPAYNHMDKRGTVKRRQEFIETEYVDGVFDAYGNEVIRPMTAEERAWLAQFYAETEHGTFAKTEEIRTQTKLLKKMLETRDEFDPQILAQRQAIEKLRAETGTFYVTDEERQAIWTNDNARGRDLFNLAKTSNNLVYVDVTEYDTFVSEANRDISAEDLKLNHLTNGAKKNVKRRKKSV